MVPLVQLTAWWPSCAPQSVFEVSREYIQTHVQPLHVVVAQAALAAANWMLRFHRVQASPEAQLAHSSSFSFCLSQSKGDLRLGSEQACMFQNKVSEAVHVVKRSYQLPI